jgi:hypothetical protein
MNFSRKIILALSLVLLISCERYYSSSIVNKSKNEIILRIKVDKDVIEKSNREFAEKGGRIDNRIAADYEIKIGSLKSYKLAGKLHSRPDFYDIKEIEIYSGDTLILKCRKDQMQKLFSEESRPNGFDLIVK